MCRTSDNENFYSDCYELISRVEHRCYECQRAILVGENFMKWFCVFGGDGAGSYNICAHCNVLMDWLGDNCGGWLWGEVVEDIYEHAEEYKRMDLARLAVGARRRWLRFKPNGYVGMPVPKCPASIYDVLKANQ